MIKTIDKILKTSVRDILNYVKSAMTENRSTQYFNILEKGFSSMEIKSTHENVTGAIINYYYSDDGLKISVDGELGEEYEKDWIIIRAYDRGGQLLFEAEGDGTRFIQPWLNTKLSEDVLWYIDDMFRDDLKKIDNKY